MPPLKVRESSGCKLGLLDMTVVVSGSLVPRKLVGARPVVGEAYNSKSDGSRNPSPHVLRIVSVSSKGCQRSPNFGTRTLVSLFLKTSKRAAAVNSSEWKPGTALSGLKIGTLVSA